LATDENRRLQRLEKGNRLILCSHFKCQAIGPSAASQFFLLCSAMSGPGMVRPIVTLV
jgi:hypothetical protein